MTKLKLQEETIVEVFRLEAALEKVKATLHAGSSLKKREVQKLLCEITIAEEGIGNVFWDAKEDANAKTQAT